MVIGRGQRQYIDGGDQPLALGYTTGSCAAAASKAALQMLLSGQEISEVSLMTPKGILLWLDVLKIRRSEGEVTCGIRKDAGDDPDVTNGLIVYATVSYREEPGIEIEGGEGIGRVTRPGLDQPVGNAAINSTPRQMIREAICEQIDPAKQGIRVVISIPGGEQVAEKTFNPKLGVIGGLSILGTTGIVMPMSEQALRDTIRVEINVRKSEQYEILPIAPGNYGKAFFHEHYGVSLDLAVASSNFIAEAIEMGRDAGFSKILFIGHIGKLIKVAGGIRNTHSKYGDHRMEITSDLVRECIKAPEAEEICTELMTCVAMDDAVEILQRHQADQAVLQCMTGRIYRYMNTWSGSGCRCEVIVFSNQHGVLGMSKQAEAYLTQLRSS
ncbi:MAG: cobalt-precorrin-5B (C(1))-methyltransferase CbiD [Lachnospiraceae bacterium]|nr:cobalt-precorrin-5B (C(1))-methyltransferase CbiD [Lachnospiraceae bacterium]